MTLRLFLSAVVSMLFVGQSAAQPLFSAPWTAPHDTVASCVMHTVIRLEKPIHTADFHIAAVGSYKLFVNGRYIGPSGSSPVSPSPYKTVWADVYNVKQKLKNGDNDIRVLMLKNKHTDALKLSAMIVTTDIYGHSDTVRTNNETWKMASHCPLTKERDGAVAYDASADMGEWIKCWQVDDFEPAILQNPVQNFTEECMETAQPVKTLSTADGNGAKTLTADFGQQIFGKLWITAGNLAKGDRLKIRFKKTDNDKWSTPFIYVAGGDENGTTPKLPFEPAHFRYAQITYPPKTQEVDLLASKERICLMRTGTIVSDDNATNDQFELMCQNLADSLSDCDNYDMKDIVGASFVYDVSGLCKKWLRDQTQIRRPRYTARQWAVMLKVCDVLYWVYGDSSYTDMDKRLSHSATLTYASTDSLAVTVARLTGLKVKDPGCKDYLLKPAATIKEINFDSPNGTIFYKREQAVQIRK